MNLLIQGYEIICSNRKQSKHTSINKIYSSSFYGRT